MKTIILLCTECGKRFPRSQSEYNRSQKLGRKSFCDISCAVKYSNRHRDPIDMSINFVGYKKPRDAFSPFRYFDKLIKGSCKKRKKYTNLTLEYLKELWDQQNGICPFSGWNLIIPETSGGWTGGSSPQNASIDRIDNSQGYIIGNIRFVAYMFNCARNVFSDTEVIEFCRAVTMEHQ